jgi:hypothetical protein
MPHKPQVGDTVVFTKSFLDRHQYASDMSVARGKVIALHRVGNDIILADIDWDKPGLPKRVNIRNLQPAGGPDSPR